MTDQDLAVPDPEITTGLEPLSDAIGNLEFDREEKARLVALMLAIKYHTETIIRDAEYLRVVIKNDLHLEPTTVEKVVRQAEAFYRFLRSSPPPQEDHHE